MLKILFRSKIVYTFHENEQPKCGQSSHCKRRTDFIVMLTFTTRLKEPKSFSVSETTDAKADYTIIELLN